MIQETKVCRICKKHKTVLLFSRSKASYDGYNPLCKTCASKEIAKHKKSKKGVMTSMYASQKYSSKKRNMSPPNYTKKEFVKWIKESTNFDELYDNWVKSKYEKNLKPSVDRIDDYVGYSFDNIQLVTWEENLKKSHIYLTGGLNNKQSKSVAQYTIDGTFIKRFYSIRQAGRETGIDQSWISKCCKGKVESTENHQDNVRKG